MACKFNRKRSTYFCNTQFRNSHFERSRDMATSCPGPGRCGTVAPVWLDMNTLVNLTSNTYSVDACVSWGFGDGGFDNFDCCLFTLPVKMKACAGFNVYYLGPTQACDIAYCSAPTSSLPSSLSTISQPPVLQKEYYEPPLPLIPPNIELVLRNDSYFLQCVHNCERCK